MVMSSFSIIATEPFQVWCSEVAKATERNPWQPALEDVKKRFLHNLNRSDRIAAFKLLRSLNLEEGRRQVTVLLHCGIHLKFLQPHTFQLFSEMWKRHEHDAGFEGEMLRCLRELTIA